MHFVLAALVLVLLLFAATWCLLAPSVRAGVVLAVFSAAWLPANNGQFEGPTLVVVSTHHGMTVGDLIGVAGVVLAAVTVWPRVTWHGRAVVWRVALVLAVLAVGFGVAALTTAGSGAPVPS